MKLIHVHKEFQPSSLTRLVAYGQPSLPRDQFATQEEQLRETVAIRER